MVEQVGQNDGRSAPPHGTGQRCTSTSGGTRRRWPTNQSRLCDHRVWPTLGTGGNCWGGERGGGYCFILFFCRVLGYWMGCTSVGVRWAAVCVCMSWIFYPATCGPKGHGSGLPLPLRTAAFSSPPLHDRVLSPTTVGYTGATLAPPPQTA